jgi:hypothetical protein
MLLEVVVSLAIFVVAGGAILTLMNQTMMGLEQSRLAAQAADLARSAMAKIEAGIETAQTLNGPIERQSESIGQNAKPSGWELQIDTDLSQFRGLTRVSVTAHKQGSAGRIDAQYTLVQLVRLGGKGDDKAGDQDSLAEKAKQGPTKSTSAPSSAAPQTPASTGPTGKTSGGPR